MPVRIRADIGGVSMATQLRDFGQAAHAAVEAGMRGVADGLVLDLRQQIQAGFPNSRRMPTTVTGAFYPATAGKDPAVLVHPRKGAGWLLAAHMGATIAPRTKKVLAIPTRAVPKIMGRQMTPDEVSGHYGEKLDFMPATGGGKAMGYLVLRKRSTGKGGRLGRARQRRAERPAVMFILVRAVTMPQRLRPEETMRRWAELAPHLIEQAARRLGVG